VGHSLDTAAAKALLAAAFAEAEDDVRTGVRVPISPALDDAFACLFGSTTQAFREALVGCTLARALDPEIDIRCPYVNQSERAFSGRSLDERVVNPFLQEREVPCSKGPYLSVLRRNVRFEAETARGLRDRDAFEAMLALIAYLGAAEPDAVHGFLRRLLLEFITLREAASIPLMRVRRLNGDQLEALIAGLLATPSGGLLPMLLTVAGFHAIRQTYGLPWDVQYQGINVADAASGAGGDITIRAGSKVVFVVEVTERPIDRARILSTFNRKIALQSLTDYLFVYSGPGPDEEALATARQLFAQGHEISFLDAQVWLITTLKTLGSEGRTVFVDAFLDLFDRREVSATLKTRWNALIRSVST